MCAFSTAIFNVLDYCSGIVPVDKVTQQDDLDLADETKWPTGNFFFNFIIFIKNFRL